MSATPAASADPPIRRSADPPIRRKLCDETSRRRLVSSHNFRRIGGSADRRIGGSALAAGVADMRARPGRYVQALQAPPDRPVGVPEQGVGPTYPVVPTRGAGAQEDPLADQ